MTRIRHLVHAAVLAGLCLGLSGCFKADVNVSITADGTVSGTMLFAYLRSGLDGEGLTPDQAVDRLRNELVVDAQGAVDCQPYETAPWIGLSCSIEDLSLEQMSAQDAFGQHLAFSRQSDRYDVSGIVDLTNYRQGTDGFQASLRVTFPAPVTFSNGRVDGTTVSWEFPPAKATSVYASSAIPRLPDAGAAGSISPAGAILIGMLALVVTALWLVSVSRRRRHDH